MRSKLLVAGLLIAILTACGPTSGSTSTSSGTGETATPSPSPVVEPEVLLQLAVSNMLEAPSKRLTGTATVSGSTQEIEIAYVGDEAKGHKVERFGELESVTDFVKVDGSLYILAGEPYWQWHVGIQDLYLVVDHWVRVAGDDPNHSPLLVFTDSQTSPWQPVGELTQDGAASDASSVVLVDSVGNRFTVSTDGTPYLVRVEMTQDSDLGPATADIALSDFGEVTETFTAPTGPIVDLQ